MTSFLIISQENKEQEKITKELYDKWMIDPFDIARLTKETTTKNLTSIGLDAIKQLQKKIFLKPRKSKTKAIVIEDAELLTIEAQNALLKVLEEPPDNTIIILVATTNEAFLPTILSRCHIIAPMQTIKKLSVSDKEEITEIITSLSQWGIGKRLKLAESLAKDKEKALVWIEKLILILREQLLEKVNQPSPTLNFQLSTLNSFQSLHTLLKTTNVNTRFAIENTLLAVL